MTTQTPSDRAGPQAEPGIHCLAFERERDGSSALQGYATFHIVRCRLKFPGCAIFANATLAWVLPPSRPMLDSQRRVKLDCGGKVLYQPSVEFDNQGIQNAFSDAAIAALLRYQPDALDGVRR